MVPKKRNLQIPRTVLRLSDLDHSKAAVLNALTSPASRRTYAYVIEQFIAWYCSEPRLALNRIVVVRYGMNGGVVCQEMKKVKPEVPVIMVSANLVDGDTLKRVDQFISKAESPRILLEKVREHLTRCIAPATGIELDKRTRASH